jgi:ABC-2 type transport system permease protein
MSKYLKVWWIFAVNSFQSQIIVRWALIPLLLGKVLRFAIFTFFIVILLDKTKALAGYTLDQTIFFFLTFNLIDIISQLLYRDVYRFRQAVVTGTFDYYLIRPYNSLFRALTSGPDLLDTITLIPLIGGIVFFMNRLQINDPLNILLYLFLLLTALLIATSFYILVLTLAVITTEIDHAVMLYRDISAMGRFPIDIYREPIRALLTFGLPVGIMMTFPVKALLGILSPVLIFYSVLFAVLMFYLSIKAWSWSLKYYSSASS